MSKAATSDRRIAFYLSLCFLLFFLLFFHGHFTGTDETAVYLETQSLYERGQLSIPHAGPHRFEGPDGRIYTHFALGQAVLALPLYALGDHQALPAGTHRVFSAWPREPGRIDAIGGARVFAVALYSPLVSSLLVGVFYLFERRLGASVRSALLAGALLGATTYVAGMSVYFLRHTTEALVILGSLQALYAFRRGAGLGALFAGTLLASATLLVRVPAAVSLPALAAYGLFAVVGRAASEPLAKIAAVVAFPAVGVLAVHMWINWLKWGTWISSPMLDQVYLFDHSIGIGLLGLLVSPGAGLIFYSPLVLLSPWLIGRFWHSHRAECLAVAALSLTFLLVAARFRYWSGIWSSPGPRYVFVLIPLLLLPLGPWLDGLRNRAAWTAVGALALVGAAVQLVLMASRWSAVIRSMGYLNFEGQDFLFAPALSPILGSARIVATGEIDIWLWRLASAAPSGMELPATAAAVFGVWLACFALCGWQLHRAILSAR